MSPHYAASAMRAPGGSASPVAHGSMSGTVRQYCKAERGSADCELSGRPTCRCRKLLGATEESSTSAPPDCDCVESRAQGEQSSVLDNIAPYTVRLCRGGSVAFRSVWRWRKDGCAIADQGYRWTTGIAQAGGGRRGCFQVIGHAGLELWVQPAPSAVPVVEGCLAVEQLVGQQVLRFMPTVRRHDIEMGHGLKACIATGVGLEQDQKRTIARANEIC